MKVLILGSKGQLGQCLNDQLANTEHEVVYTSRWQIDIAAFEETNAYQVWGDLKVELLGRGFAWLDTGTHDSLLDAGQFVQTVEHRQGLKVACLEEIAFHNGWLSKDLLLKQADALKKTSYGDYLYKVAGGYK